MIRPLLFLFAITLCYGCSRPDPKQSGLQAKIDSLERVIAHDQVISGTLREISVLIDSIDVNRSMIGHKIDEEDGSLKELTARMKVITAFVKESQEKIRQLDQQLLVSGNNYKQYSATIKTLEANLASRNRELSILQTRAQQYDNQNQNLIHLVDLQKSEIEDKLVQLQVKQEELSRLEEGVDRLLTTSAESRADNCFARAQLLEEAANRTKLAPRKKRNTRLEALELYKMASFYGKEEARSKISELEKKI